MPYTHDSLDKPRGLIKCIELIWWKSEWVWSHLTRSEFRLQTILRKKAQNFIFVFPKF